MCPEQRVRIVLADDHPAALDQAARVLGEHWDVVARTRDGLELLAAVARVAPDVVVLDVGMPHLDGFEAARRLRDEGFRGAIVFISVCEDPDYAAEARRIGADGYVV